MVALVPLVLVPALGAVQGGFEPDAWVWAGALAAWACAVTVVLTAAPGALRRAWPWVAATGGLLLWTLASTSWSADAAQSLLDARRTLVYAAVVLALVLLARQDATRVLVLATHAAVSGLVVYALARYLLGPRRQDQFEGHLLNQPLGYANGVGILAALGILLALGISSGTAPRLLRAAAGATVPPLALALQLTGSHASWLALGVGIALAGFLEPAPLRLLTTAAAVAPPVAVLVWLGWYSDYATSVAAPHVGGQALCLAAAGASATAAAAVASVRPEAREASRRTRRLLALAAVVAALGGAAAVAGSGSTEPRASYWHVAWHDEYRNHALLGSGAGTFGGYWARSGRALDLGGALDAHSLYLETLAELGPAGLALLAAMLLLPLRGALRSRRVPYLPAAAGAYAAFLVHAGLDWDWELPAVVVTGLCCAAAVALTEIGLQRPLGTMPRALLFVAACVLGASAIAGVRSEATPAAGPKAEKAPGSGAFQEHVAADGYGW